MLEAKLFAISRNHLTVGKGSGGVGGGRQQSLPVSVRLYNVKASKYIKN